MEVDEKQYQEQQENYLDGLPDEILPLIINKLTDHQSLIRCLTISKGFASLALQADSVFLLLPHPLLKVEPKFRHSRHSPIDSFASLFEKIVHTSARVARQLIAARKSDSSNDWYYWPNIALKDFKQIKFVHMALPCCDDEIDSETCDDSFLRWEAEFGHEMKSCVVLIASSLRRKTPFSTYSDALEEDRDESGIHIIDDEFKLRVVWTMSSLLAASMRHYLVKQMVENFPALRRVVITDGNKQGRLRMGEKEVSELRESLKYSTAKNARTRLPDLRMKLLYAPELDLPASGFVMTAATLVLVSPREGADIERVGDDFGVEGDEDHGAYAEAVKKMISFKRSYVLPLISF